MCRPLYCLESVVLKVLVFIIQMVQRNNCVCFVTGKYSPFCKHKSSCSLQGMGDSFIIFKLVLSSCWEVFIVNFVFPNCTTNLQH